MEAGDMKWMFIAMAVVFSAPMVVSAVDKYSKNNAKRDIIVACYNAGNKNCQEIWDRTI